MRQQPGRDGQTPRGTGPVSHPSVRLAPGRHLDPRDGACAVELASLLAQERFTDRPASVCPVLAAFVRGYNDALEPELRADLHGVASTIVGTRTRCDLVRARRSRELLRWPRELRFWYPRSPDAGPGYFYLADAGYWTARIARKDTGAHHRTVALLERLALIGRGPTTAPATPPRPLTAHAELSCVS
jgi:hypothetical protein